METTIYKQIKETIQKIISKEDMYDIISDINKIRDDLYKLPLYHEFIEMVALFEKTYNTALMADIKKEVE